jgi:hypothetical protein
MSWAAVVTNVAQSYMALDEAYNQSKIVEAEAKLNETLAGIEARQLEYQATQIEAAGTRAAMIEQQKTRQVSSDAVAAMAAGGGTVDEHLLAKIKAQGDYNSMSAIYDARTQAIDLRYQAKMTRIGARLQTGSAQRYGSSLRREATTGAIFNSMDLFTKAYKPTSTPRPGYGKPPTRGPHS